MSGSHRKIYVDFKERMPDEFKPELLVSASTGLCYEIHEFHQSRRTRNRYIFEVSRIGNVPYNNVPHVSFNYYKRDRR